MEEIINLVQQYVKEKNLYISSEEIEEEYQRLKMEQLVHSKYSAMQGKYTDYFNPYLNDDDFSALYEIAIENKLIEKAVENIICCEKIKISKEEKEQEAHKISLTQNLSQDVILEFLGDNLDLLERDIKYRKALEWLKNKNKQ